MNKSASRSVWDTAARDADLTLALPGGVPLFLRRIPAGEFFMGSRGNDSDEEPRHRMKIARDFFLGTFVVTQEQWRAVAERDDGLRERADPSHFKGARRPVEQVSWDDADAWCAALMGRPEFPRNLSARLPTEAEWEFACRAGNETEYWNGDGEAALAEVGWYESNANHETHAVDERDEAHPLGLFGLHGNVWEWCRDVYRGEVYRQRVDGDASGEEKLREGEAHDRQHRVVRGGSWGIAASVCRSAFRCWWEPDVRDWGQGFRLCLAPGPADKSQPEQEAEAKPGAGDGGRGTSPESDAPGAAGAGGANDWSGGLKLPAQPAEK